MWHFGKTLRTVIQEEDDEEESTLPTVPTVPSFQPAKEASKAQAASIVNEQKFPSFFFMKKEMAQLLPLVINNPLTMSFLLNTRVLHIKTGLVVDTLLVCETFSLSMARWG